MAFIDCFYLDALYWTLAEEFADALDEQTFAETVKERANYLSHLSSAE
jgi:hypothetical protein